jgi:hypothetical protein
MTKVKSGPPGPFKGSAAEVRWEERLRNVVKTNAEPSPPPPSLLLSKGAKPKKK